MGIIDKDLLDSAKSGKARKGKRELIKHLEGGKLTRSQAVKAKCFDCSGMGEMKGCDQETCPLLPFSPYRTRNTTISRAINEKKPF